MLILHLFGICIFPNGYSSRGICKYSYDCSEAKTSHYVYHLLEVLCTECGFCTLEDIGNIYYYPICCKHLTYSYIALHGFEY